MIIIRISGGLGNQMFQYALGRSISKKNNTILKLDTNPLLNSIRLFSLSYFDTKGEISNEEDIASIGVPKIYDKSFFGKAKRKIFRIVEQSKPVYKKKFILEPQFAFCSDILKTKNNCYLSGDWQSEKYFEDIKDIIKKDFTLKNKISETTNDFIGKIEHTASISIHIRRGDYVKNSKTNSFHGTCPITYYEQAIKIIEEKISNPEFFIFSDDIDWVKANLKIKYPITYVSGNNIPDYEELILMSHCKHNIIANSTFSWWGAWLNSNPNKIVIAPEKWFNSDTDTRDLIPEGWIKI